MSRERLPQQSGFACFVGRPNVGKSTLTNALVGTKVAITSSKPQTTRTVVRGIVHRPDAQLVLVDTPGLHRPRTLLGERLNDLVRTTWAEVDVVAVCFPADQKIGPGRPVPGQGAGQGAAHDEVRGRHQDRPGLARADRRAPARHRRARRARPAPSGPRSCRSRPWPATRSPCWPTCWSPGCPEGPQLYPDGELTDVPEAAIVAELVREAALEGARDELPHSIAVVVEEMGLREDRPADRPLLDIHAILFVERESQKGIVIGHKGAAAQADRLRRPPADRGDARHPGAPRPAGQAGQGLAARPPPAAPPRLLSVRLHRLVEAPRYSRRVPAFPCRLALAAALLLAAGCGGSDERGDGGTGESDAATAPALGTCAVLEPEDVEQPTNSSPRVPCAKEHTAQTFAVGTFPAALRTVSWSDRRLGRYIFRTCGPAYATFLGGDESEVLRTMMSWAWFRPSEKAWKGGAHWYRCDVVGGQEDATAYRPLPARLKGYLGGPPRDAWLLCARGADVNDEQVPCSEKHDWRAVTTIKLGEPADTYPGDRLAQIRSQQFCSASVGAWLNYPVTDYRYGTTVFHAAEWKAGNRRSICWAATDA